MVCDSIGTILAYFIPVNNIPPVRDIFGATVLVVEVVSMLCDIGMRILLKLMSNRTKEKQDIISETYPKHLIPKSDT